MTFRARSDDKQKDRPVDVKRDPRLMNTTPANLISSIAHVDASGMPAMERSVGSDVGFSVDSYRTAVTDDHAGADLGIRMKINEGHN
jgi:hypothetical protein